MKKLIGYVLALALGMCMFYACGTSRKATMLKQRQESVGLALPKESEFVQEAVSAHKRPDRIVVKGDDGEDLILMKAIKDDETGEMVANEVLEAAVVTARFRNKAERNGQVTLEFDVHVPKSMIESSWQTTVRPEMYILEDTLHLEPIVLTGEKYREQQLKGYELYDRYVESIITDTTRFVNRFLLEQFIQRNIPDLWALKTDSTFLTPQQFETIFSVTDRQAVDHYTYGMRVRRNRRRIGNKDAMYAKYVKNPIVTEGLRLDSIVNNSNGDVTYCYSQTIKTRPELRKVDVVLSGDIRDAVKQIYTIPTTDPLTFYISSLASFVQPRERYMTKVIERRAEANQTYNIGFRQGKTDIDPEFMDNTREINRIKDNLRALMENKVFDLDSVVIVAHGSPEGSYAVNERISAGRSRSVTDYFSQYIRTYRDSLDAENGFQIDEFGNVVREESVNIRLVSHSIPENWDDLNIFVDADEVLTESQKDSYRKIVSRDRNVDRRDNQLRRQEFYGYLSDSLYPRLRTVKFNFHLHRKGMVKDTIQTTVLDTTYQRGLQLLHDRDFEKAVEVLRPYNDINTAVAYLAMDYNQSALSILQHEERTADVNYMLAILYSRLGDDQSAVDSYLQACRQDPAFVPRGNLDPEISVLIRTYGLNRFDDEEEF